MNARIKRFLLAYVVAAVIFAVIDLVWITQVAVKQYDNYIPDLMAPSVNLAGGAVFYLIYVVGMVHFGVQPNNADATLRKRLTGAALFGFFTYATWSLTGLAVLKGFPAIVAITDIAWGVVACTLVTWLTVLVLGKIHRSRKTVQ